MGPGSVIPQGIFFLIWGSNSKPKHEIASNSQKNDSPHGSIDQLCSLLPHTSNLHKTVAQIAVTCTTRWPAVSFRFVAVCHYRPYSLFYGHVVRQVPAHRSSGVWVLASRFNVLQLLVVRQKTRNAACESVSLVNASTYTRSW